MVAQAKRPVGGEGVPGRARLPSACRRGDRARPSPRSAPLKGTGVVPAILNNHRKSGTPAQKAEGLPGFYHARVGEPKCSQKRWSQAMPASDGHTEGG